VGEFDATGQLLIKGRKKEMIVTPQGLNVFPEDVERAILAQPGVRDAAVVGLHTEGEERIHAILVLAPGADPRAIVRHANAALEDHQRVWSISTWPGSALPRTEGTQKLKRRELQRWAAGESGGQPRTAPPATSVSAVVARFAGGREPGPDTTMDELGLSSLDRVELMMALEEAFHVTLDESSVAAAKTVGDLERLVDGGTAEAEPPPSPPLRRTSRNLEPRNLEPGTRNLGTSEPRNLGTPEPPPPPRLRRTSRNPFPTWNRRPVMRFVRRISLPTWILPLARVFLRLRVEGLEHLATLDGPAIFASNHQSHLDTPTIMIALPTKWRYRLAPAMAKEFFAAHFHPEGATRGKRIVIGAAYYLACEFFNAFPLPQSGVGTRDTLRYIGEVLADGDSVLIFPEGQFSETGDIGTFRPGIGMMAARLGVPVVPVRIEGLTKVLHPTMRWPRRGPVRVAFGAPLHLRGDDYTQLARQVEEAVTRI
jgi:long-chain acyl-CoA synthetase